MPHKKNISKICSYCKKEFLTSQYALNKSRQFCSNKCHYNSKNNLVINKCQNCGKEFFARPDHIKIGWGRFCSKSCANQGKFNPLFNKRGNLNPNWKGGIVPLKRSLRTQYIYRQWRDDVFTRDNYICQECNKRGGYLEAHHKESWSIIFDRNNIKTLEEAINCQELWNINNGITLCKDCHKKTLTYLNKGKENGTCII